MSEVRVHVRLGTLRLDYHGAQAFYEAHVESLVAAAASRGVRAGTASHRPGRYVNSHAHGSPSERGADGAPAAPEAVDDASDASREASGPTSSASAPAAEAPTGYKPASPEFGRYLRRLGTEADAPDRHVLAFAFYLWNYERLETFGLPEIAGCLKAIGRDLPEDVDALMDDLAEKRRLLESAGPGLGRLAKKGEDRPKSVQVEVS